jgi:hypothetical protein
MNKEKLERKIKDYLKKQLIASKTNFTGISDELRAEKLICFSLEYDRAFQNKFDAYYYSNNIRKKILFKNDVFEKVDFGTSEPNFYDTLANIFADLELEIHEFEARIAIKD